MSQKTFNSTPQGRRTPLSLSGGVSTPKTQQNKVDAKKDEDNAKTKNESQPDNIKKSARLSQQKQMSSSPSSSNTGSQENGFTNGIKKPEQQITSNITEKTNATTTSASSKNTEQTNTSSTTTASPKTTEKTNTTTAPPKSIEKTNPITSASPKSTEKTNTTTTSASSKNTENTEVAKKENKTNENQKKDNSVKQKIDEKQNEKLSSNLIKKDEKVNSTQKQNDAEKNDSLSASQKNIEKCKSEQKSSDSKIGEKKVDDTSFKQDNSKGKILDNSEKKDMIEITHSFILIDNKDSSNKKKLEDISVIDLTEEGVKKTKQNDNSTLKKKSPLKPKETEEQKTINISDQQDDILMEPLTYEEENVGQPEASSTPGKILRYTKKEIPLRETISINSVEKKYQFDDKMPISRSSKRISGRRSYKNVSFENINAGVYRTVPDDDRWPSSLNVTIGSENPNNDISTNSCNSFSFFGRIAKKREHTPQPTTVVVQDAIEFSPKRARLEPSTWSGLFGGFSSPMTFLKEKFSKTKLTKQEEDEDEEVNIIDEDLQVKIDDVIDDASAVVAEIDLTTKEILNNKNEEDDQKMDEEEEEMGDIVIKETPLNAGADNNERRRMCNIM